MQTATHGLSSPRAGTSGAIRERSPSGTPPRRRSMSPLRRGWSSRSHRRPRSPPGRGSERRKPSRRSVPCGHGRSRASALVARGLTISRRAVRTKVIEEVVFRLGRTSGDKQHAPARARLRRIGQSIPLATDTRCSQRVGQGMNPGPVLRRVDPAPIAQDTQRRAVPRSRGARCGGS